MTPVEEIAGGVYRLGTKWVGWYLVEVDGAVTVVDCGFSGYFAQLPAALSELGRPLDAVTAGVLTPYHSDHLGPAERIRREAGAPGVVPTGAPGGGRGG